MISVVIATIGGPELAATLAALQQGTLVPDEILVCLPVGSEERAAQIATERVAVRICSCRGQVAQRAEGFRAVRGDLVLQLDDDITLDPTCLENLVRALNTLPQRSTVAPIMLDKETGASVYARPNNFSRRVVFFLMNGSEGYHPGWVTRSGLGMGVEITAGETAPIAVRWVPGGCALHRREALVLETFFPFPGKAFCEDLYHSAELMARGVSLFVIPNAKCYLDESDVAPERILDVIKNLNAELCAVWEYLNRYGSRSPRILVYAAVSVAHQVRRFRPQKRKTRPDGAEKISQKS